MVHLAMQSKNVIKEEGGTGFLIVDTESDLSLDIVPPPP